MNPKSPGVWEGEGEEVREGGGEGVREGDDDVQIRNAATERK